MELPKAYNPADYEDKIYEKWEKEGLFNPDTAINNGGPSMPLGVTKPKGAFSIVLPPPNVTGTLHLGHAAMLAIEDLMIRYKRMNGFDSVWVPGTDHASIATQNVVEKKLWREKKLTRHDLGRKKFLDEVEKFVDQSKDIIHYQLRKMGSSLDWSREAYTLDETRSKAVRKVFKMMYDDGLIYRGDRVVNWCPRCASTLADDELVYKEVDAKLYTFKYDKSFPFYIATTRPETKLGDTAVAVNPKDKRYAKYAGKTFQANFCGVNLALQIISERGIEMDFGTGALGVTPAHSMVDYEMAQKNGLAMIKVIDETGRITDAGGKYFGLTAEEAREKIVTELKKAGLLKKEEEIKHNISLCYRCKSVIEPLPSKQWFVDVNAKVKIKRASLGAARDDNNKEMSLKEMAVAVVKNKKIEFIPDRFEKIYNNWMENLHDWCISRQIWFGHRIPVWYKKDGKDTEIFLMRHGEALSNKLNQLNSDVNNQKNGLTAKGKKQAEATAKKLRSEKFEIIIASDFKRAKETAEIAAKALKIKVIIDERLREVGVGKFEGRSDHEMTAFREGKGFKNWHHKSPGGIESFDKLKKRVFSAMSDFQRKYKGKKILIVTHGDVIRVARGFGKEMSDEAIFHLGYPDVANFIKLTIPAEEQIRVSEKDINERGWVQDSDTLDTWFSSGLWSFTALLPKDWDGKKFDSADIKRFHPTSVLETGYDILPFWVSRMILMTNYVMGEVPFEKVYLHGLIRDKDGDKMSKSKPETAIDPVEAGKKYGFDAVRLSLLIGNTAGNDVKLYDEKIESYRNFVNKLWNIARFVLMSVDDVNINTNNIDSEFLEDRAILSDINVLKSRKIVGGMSEGISGKLDIYDFSNAGHSLKMFTWSHFADWYLEFVKTRKDKIKDQVLLYVLKDLLKMWHPFVPFVTEAIWQKMGMKTNITFERWPEQDRVVDKKAIADFDDIAYIIVLIRNARAENNIPYSKELAVVIAANKNAELIEENSTIIKQITKLSELRVIKVSKANPFVCPVGFVSAGTSDFGNVFVNVAGAVDVDKERARLEKERDNLNTYIVQLEKKLGNEQFVENAPENVVQQEKDKLFVTQERLNKIEKQLSEL